MTCKTPASFFFNIKEKTEKKQKNKQQQWQKKKFKKKNTSSFNVDLWVGTNIYMGVDSYS